MDKTNQRDLTYKSDQFRQNIVRSLPATNRVVYKTSAIILLIISLRSGSGLFHG